MRPERNSETMSANICSNSYLFFKCGFSSTNRRKVSLVCVIILLFVFLKETTCQDKQNESTRMTSVDVSHDAPLIPSYPLYCCYKDFPRNGNTTTDPSSTDVSSCKLLSTEIDISNMKRTLNLTSWNFRVQMQTKEMRCSSESKPTMITFRTEDENVQEEQNKTDEKNKLLDNGYLKVGDEYNAPDEFCVQKNVEGEVEFLVCPKNCTNRVCVRKCCRLDELISLKKNSTKRLGCERPSVPGKNFRPPFYHDYATRITKAEENDLRMPHYTQIHPNTIRKKCFRNSINMTPYSKKFAEKITTHMNSTKVSAMKFRVRIDGNLLYRHSNGECKAHTEFCVDGVQTHGDDTAEPFMNSEDEMGVFSCAIERVVPGGDTVSQVYGPLMLSVSIFPFLTTLVYVLLWRKQTIHGLTIVSTSTSLLFMYIFIGTSHVLRIRYGTSIHFTKSCVFVAVAAHFFFLSTFSWLTIMCFDLWWTFRTLTPRNRQSKGIQRFICYIVFGWGIPSVIIAVSLAIHYMEDNCNQYLIVPAYGVDSCYLHGRALGVYLYYPSIAFLIINVIFFSITCLKLYQYRQSCQMANKTDMKECFSRFTKLFFVMGVTWVFEIISWAVEGMGFFWYWAVFDIVNILRAAAVFIIYVCKRDILSSLQETYPKLKELSHAIAEPSVNSMEISKDGTTMNTMVLNPLPSTSTSTAPSNTDSTDFIKL